MGTKAKKGSQFERDISRWISRWWSDGERDDLVWRTSQSGGRATTRAKSGRKTAGGYGDLTFTDSSIKPLFDTFLFELKRGYTTKIDPLSFIDGKGSKNFLGDVYEKAWKECKYAEKKYPIIIFERNRRETCIMFNHKLMQLFEKFSGIFSKKYMMFDTTINRYYIMIISDFFEWVSPETIKLISKTKRI